MRGLLHALFALLLLTPLPAMAADEKVLMELNTVESTDKSCRVNFVLENKLTVGIQSMKLDLVAFGTDGAILQRFLVEILSLRPAKTMVRQVLFTLECRQLGAILVNDVTACAPAEPGACLDALVLSSRLKELRLYK